ncbi:LVIVD repeat-containing protein [Agromyces aerolatus]|uniref:LVIVD repeat-containing protein n=1 Tax=Agromyces sp. LY-1074 TaxID=3074080 RepID=UPI0028664B4B|nr:MULTISPECIES: hypothetical protein [unclassified Agromyces]MDR5699971.1 hypothetical protein [Agromyces sp. LY-1074]MDR5706217.1 hypothetical protein [Agromyces sp. LY-1358]
MRRTAGSLAVLGALLALAVAAPAAGPATASEPDPRAPAMGPGLEWVAHRDNPFRQGDDPDFINSDLAFTGDHLIQGNFAGFSVWDIADPANPDLRSTMPCTGGQGDVSAVGDLVIVSIDETMSSDACDAVRVPETEENWEGLRLFDVSDPSAPRHVGSVRTRCGSHTHTVVPDPADATRVFVYVSAYSRGASLNCTGRNPLQIVSIPLATPEQATIAGELDLFDDETAFGPGDRVAGGAETRSTTGCHDITAYPAKALAVAACRGDGLLLSIADPLSPVVLQRVRDANVAFWHSGIFDNDATAVVFQDELGDGFINTCSPAFGGDRGADAIWSLTDGVLEHRSYFKIPRPQSDLEKCVAHSGGLIPVPGRFIVAQAWLEGGVSVIDLTDPAAPTELTYFDRPSYGYSMDFTAGIWSVYFYNGHLFASDMYDGLEVLRLTDPLFADAARYTAGDLNPQTQPAYSWVWREAPLLPADAAGRAALAPLELSPAEVQPGETPTVEVALPAGSLEPGETVDVWWMPGASVLATLTATADGALAPTIVTVPGPLEAGDYDLVARGDRTSDRLALGVLEVAAPEPTPTPEPAAGADGMPNGWLIGIAAGALLIGAAAGWVARRRAKVLAKRRSTSEHSP